MLGVAGAGVGLLVDRAVGDPPTVWHPVAWFGSAMTWIETHVWRDTHAAGAVYAACGVAVGVAVGSVVRSVPVAVAVAAAGRGLRTAGSGILDELDHGDLEGARRALPTLVGRDPSGLDESGVAAAVVESIAENTVDAVVAPVFWALVAGAPGVCAHRAINTMDAMVGHRSARYARFGTASAVLDDAANYVPARLTAALLCAVAPARATEVVRLVRRDASAHPSPNAGVAETAAAAVLGVELGGPLTYGTQTEQRPRLGDGPRPDVAAGRAMVRLQDRAELALVAGLLVVGIAGRVWRR